MRVTNVSPAVAWCGGGALVALIAFGVASCGGGASLTIEAGAARIDQPAVERAVADFDGFVAICRTGTGALQAQRKVRIAERLHGAAMLVARQGVRQRGVRPLALSSTPPADELGGCGGRFGYRDYVQSGNVTTGVLSFENYCDLDSDTGERQVVDGSVRFVNTATTTTGGSETARVTADTVRPLTITITSSTGAPVSSQTIRFERFDYGAGVPGGSPTAARPDVVSAASISVTNNDTRKVYRQTDYRYTQYSTSGGGLTYTLAGRGYRSDGSFFQISTEVPITQDDDGNTVSGRVVFSGQGTTAVATVVPGSTLQATLAVNGQPVTSVPACGA